VTLGLRTGGTAALTLGIETADSRNGEVCHGGSCLARPSGARLKNLLRGEKVAEGRGRMRGHFAMTRALHLQFVFRVARSCLLEYPPINEVG
jgi:hypothetical protein